MNKRALLATALAIASVPAAAQFGGRRRGALGSAAPDEKSAAREATPVLETTLHEFHEDLKLSAEQEPLFDAYADAIRALGRDLLRERAPSASAAKLALLQRVARNVDTMRNRLTAVEEIASAANTLYTRLTPEQQAAADPRLATLMMLPLNAAGPDSARKPPARG